LRDARPGLERQALSLARLAAVSQHLPAIRVCVLLTAKPPAAHRAQRPRQGYDSVAGALASLGRS
jgi:hypothetical protein